MSEPESMHFPASIRGRYEKIEHFPEAYLVFGDAIASFNPTLEPRFFRRAAKIVDMPWAGSGHGGAGNPVFRTSSCADPLRVTYRNRAGMSARQTSGPRTSSSNTPRAWDVSRTAVPLSRSILEKPQVRRLLSEMR